MYAVRRWSVRHARLLEIIYHLFERLFVALHPLWNSIGYARIERPIAVVEKGIKGFLFDCQMCGQCFLNVTGMSCPMNCPKELTNGPCGGVRPDGNCEVKPDMHCVWVDAWEGSQRMRNSNVVKLVQKPVDYKLKGTSSWLRVAREKAVLRQQAVEEQA